MGTNQFLTFPTVAIAASGPQAAIDLYSLVPNTGLDSDLTFICDTASSFQGFLIIEASSDNATWFTLDQFLVNPDANRNETAVRLSPLHVTLASTVRYLRLNVRAVVTKPVVVTVAGEKNDTTAVPLTAANVKLFGATGDGVTDDTAAFQAAINSQTGPVNEIYVPAGLYRITSTLSYPATTQHIAWKGDNPMGIAPAVGRTFIYCHEVTGVLIDATSAAPGTLLEGLTICDLYFDGGNRRCAPGNYSTTWTGLWNTASTASIGIHVRNVFVTNSSATQAKAFDLSYAYWALIENSYVSYFNSGWAVYSFPFVSISTTLTVRKCYFIACCECICVEANCVQLDVEDTVLEHSIVGCAVNLGNFIHFKNCWFEQMGKPTVTRSTSITKQGMGYASAQDPSLEVPIDTEFHAVCASLVFDNCYFVNSAEITSIAWFRGLGGPSGFFYKGGSVYLNECRNFQHTNATGYPVFPHEPSNLNRNGFQYILNDSRVIGQSGPAHLMTYPQDFRQVTKGVGHIWMSPFEFQTADIDNGRFTYGTYPYNYYASGPTGAPYLATNLVGDKVMVATPTSGGYIGFVCVNGGVPGTWKGFGLIQS